VDRGWECADGYSTDMDGGVEDGLRLPREGERGDFLQHTRGFIWGGKKKRMGGGEEGSEDTQAGTSSKQEGGFSVIFGIVGELISADYVQIKAGHDQLERNVKGVVKKASKKTRLAAVGRVKGGQGAVRTVGCKAGAGKRAEREKVRGLGSRKNRREKGGEAEIFAFGGGGGRRAI